MSARGRLIECLGPSEAFLREFFSCFLQVIPERCFSSYAPMISFSVLLLSYTHLGFMDYQLSWVVERFVDA